MLLSGDPLSGPDGPGSLTIQVVGWFQVVGGMAAPAIPRESKPMKRRNLFHRKLRLPSIPVRPEDGIDTRRFPRGGPSGRNHRKTRQLCSQIAEALSYVLGQCDDEVLQALYVDSVEPAPNASRLLVTVGSLPAERLDPAAVLEHLGHASGRLRSEVAAAITRRKTPTLVYRYAIPTGTEDH